MITSGNISVKVMYDFEMAVCKYFNSKDIAEGKQVTKIIVVLMIIVLLTGLRWNIGKEL